MAQSMMQKYINQNYALCNAPVKVLNLKPRQAVSSRFRRRVIHEPKHRPFSPDSEHLKEWNLESWRNFPALQQPDYPSEGKVKEVSEVLKGYPPLVFAGECRSLQERLAKAATGDAFVVQGGDCAEAFAQFQANRIRDSYRVLLQMSLVMMFAGGLPIVKMGNILFLIKF